MALRGRIDACRAMLDSLNLGPTDPRRAAIDEILEELDREWSASFAPIP
ncbi:MAG: hypothetical protein R2762_00870 [Bryobacteraceae bacterium]